MASILKPVLTLAGGALLAKFAPSMRSCVGPAVELAMGNPVASLAAAVATVSTTALVCNKMRQSPNKNEAARRMSAAASKNVVRSRSSAILAHPIQHALRSTRSTDENNAVRWKKILRRIVGIIQLTGVGLATFLIATSPSTALALPLFIGIYSLVSFALTFKLTDHYRMNEPTRRPVICNYEDEIDLNHPENRSNLSNSLRFVAAAFFAPIAAASLALDALTNRAKKLAEEAAMR